MSVGEIEGTVEIKPKDRMDGWIVLRETGGGRERKGSL
jgi:hypothetical protein